MKTTVPLNSLRITPRHSSALLLSLLLGLSFGTRATHAAVNYTWQGGGTDTNWSTTGNWTGSTVPLSNANSAVSINATGTSNVDSPWSLLSLTFSSGSAAVTGSTISFSSVSSGATTSVVINSGGTGTHSIYNNIYLGDTNSNTGAWNRFLFGTAMNLYGNITTAGSGASTRLQFAGSGARNVYGNINLTTSGTLLLRDSSTTNVYSTGNTIGTITTWAGANLYLQVANAFSASTFLNNGGIVGLNGYDQTFGGFIAATGTVTTTTAATLTINSSADSVYGGVLSGSLTLKKTGAATLELDGANTNVGNTTVENGKLIFNSVASGATAQALGKGTAVTLGAASSTSGTLQYSGAAGTLDKNVYAVGSGLNTIVNGGSGLLTLSGSLVKNGTVLVLNGGNSGINVTGTISGSSTNSDLYITGGTTTLSTVNTYNGPTWVYGGGTLVNGVNNALPTSTTLILGGTDNTNGTFDLNGKNQTVAGLSGTGTGTQTVTNNGASTSTLTVTGGGTYSGVIANGSGTTALTVNGGDLVLGGINTYTGATTVTGGTLTVNGSLSADSAVTVTGATLAGSGSASGTVSGSNATINGNGLNLGATVLKGTSTLSGYNIASSVTVTGGTTTLTGTTKSTSALSVSQGATLNANGGTIDGSAAVSGLLKGNSTITGNLTLTSGTLAPGNSTGITKITGNLTVDGASKLVAEVSGTVAGTSYDQVQVGGSVSLAGTLDLTTLSGLTLGSKITLIDNTGSGTTTGYFATIITSDSTYTATSNSDYTFTVAGTEYLLSYASDAGSDGNTNDVTLTVVPEPGTWAMLVGGIGMLAFSQRLRSRRS